jgi:3-hydroxyacyl-[acyl-carrier protein] dehydratase/trans-2-decenoyl-[acyl-carrier protein] isomerase
MKYDEFTVREKFSLENLIAFSYGRLIDDPPQGFDARLPAPPFLMVDRVLTVKSNGRGGTIIAEQDVKIDAWYFQCHMPGDPVQPGCLCVDAIWQLLGFYCVWRGALGSGRALGCGEVVFNGQIRPLDTVIRYEIEVKRFSQLKQSGSCVVVGNGRVFVDDEAIMTINGARVGVFRGIRYGEYPRYSPNARGGILERTTE